MKKLVLLLFVALISIQISAQEFHFIPRVGFNLANTYPESFADMRPGVNVGVAGEIRFSKLFALEPGIYYSMQGHRYKYKGETSKLNVDYLKAKAANFQYELNYKPSETRTFSGDIKDDVRNCDLSFSMGAGYAFDMGLVLSANYNLGCTYLYRDSQCAPGSVCLFKGKEHNGVIQFNVGWRF